MNLSPSIFSVSKCNACFNCVVFRRFSQSTELCENNKLRKKEQKQNKKRFRVLHIFERKTFGKFCNPNRFFRACYIIYIGFQTIISNKKRFGERLCGIKGDALLTGTYDIHATI